MAKRKTMTKAQKAMNAKIKKELQEKGRTGRSTSRKPGRSGTEGMQNIMHGMCSCIRQSASCSGIRSSTCEPLLKR